MCSPLYLEAIDDALHTVTGSSAPLPNGADDELVYIPI